jgi:hypothetical protein
MGAADPADISRAGWRTSSHSANAGNCAEVAASPAGTVAVRDSKDRQGPVLVFQRTQWRRFAARVKAGTRATT